jgi:hypothetical protein
MNVQNGGKFCSRIMKPQKSANTVAVSPLITRRVGGMTEGYIHLYNNLRIYIYIYIYIYI